MSFKIQNGWYLFCHLVNELQQLGDPVSLGAPQPRLVDLRLSVEDAGDDGRLRPQHGSEPLVVLLVRVALEDVFSLVERLLRYALKLSGGVENSMPVA